MEDFDANQENTALPEEGWHKARLTEIEVRKSKKGKDMRVCEFLAAGYYATVYLTVGNEGQGGEIARNMYRNLATCCGIEKDENERLKFEIENIVGQELYVRLEHETSPGYAPKAVPKDWRPMDRPPEEIIEHTEEEEEEDDPFDAF